MSLRNRIVLALGVFLLLLLAMGTVSFMNLKAISTDVVALHGMISQVTAVQGTEAEDLIGQIRDADIAAERTFLVSFLTTFVLAVGCGYFILRAFGNLKALIGHVQTAGIQVNSSVTQIAATAKEQQATA